MALRFPAPLLLLLLAACSGTPDGGPGPAGEDIERVRRRTLEALARRRPLDPALLARCQDPDPRVRRILARTLGRYRNPDLKGDLLPLLRDPDRAVRIEAYSALSLMGREAALLGLSGLTDRDPAIRLLATTLVGLAGQEDMTDALLARLDDQDGWVRGEAGLALGRLVKGRVLDRAGRSRALDALVSRGEKEQSHQVRWRIAWALSHLLPADSRRGLRLLLAWCADPQAWRVRFFAIRALTRISPSSPEVLATLRQATEDPIEAVALEALRTLYLPGYPNLPDHPADRTGGRGRRAEATDLAILDQFVNSGSTARRVAACRCLGHLPNPPRESLFKALADPSPTVRGAALIALTRLSRGAFGAMLDQFLQDERWQVRQAVALAAALTGEEQARTILSRLVRDADPRVRLAACRSLDRVCHSGSGTELARDLLADGQPPVVAAAARLLARLRPHNLEEVLATAWMRARQPAHWSTRCAILEVLNRAGSITPLPAELQIRRDAAGDPLPPVRRLAGGMAGPGGTEKSGDHLAPAPPESDIPPAGTILTLTTGRGDIRIRMDVKRAPLHAALWARLARGGRLRGRQVHHQDPTFGVKAFGGTLLGPAGVDDRGRLMADEIARQPIEAGTVLATAAAGEDRGTDGLFFCLVPCPDLEGRMTVLGHLEASSYPVVAKLEPGDRIESARITTP